MKRMIWAIAAAAVFMTGCQGTTRVWMTNKEYNGILGSDCFKLASLSNFKAPTSIEDAKTKREEAKERAEGQKSRSFSVPSIKDLNKSYVDIVRTDQKIYSLYVKTPIDQWATSEKIQNLIKARDSQVDWFQQERESACKKKEG